MTSVKAARLMERATVPAARMLEGPYTEISARAGCVAYAIPTQSIPKSRHIFLFVFCTKLHARIEIES